MALLLSGSNRVNITNLSERSWHSVLKVEGLQGLWRDCGTLGRLMSLSNWLVSRFTSLSLHCHGTTGAMGLHGELLGLQHLGRSWFRPWSSAKLHKQNALFERLHCDHMRPYATFFFFTQTKALHTTGTQRTVRELWNYSLQEHSSATTEIEWSWNVRYRWPQRE